MPWLSRGSVNIVCLIYFSQDVFFCQKRSVFLPYAKKRSLEKDLSAGR